MEPKSATTYRFEGFILEPADGRLLREGVRVSLTPKEFDLLVLLVSAKGRLVAKSELLDRLWPDVSVSENNLTTTVSNVRKALDLHEPLRYIENVPKKGYRFVADVEIRSEEGNPPSSPRLTGSKYLLCGLVLLALACIGAILWGRFSTRPSTRKLYERAIELERQGKDKSALDVLDEILGANPDFADARVRGAWIEYQDDENDAGLKYLSDIGKQDGHLVGDPHSRCIRLKAEALQFLLTGDQDDALRKLQLASEADSTDADALYYLADLANDMRLHEQSATALSRCLQLDKGHPGCTFDLMVLRIRQGRSEEIPVLRETAVKVGVRDPWLDEPSGYADLATGRTEDALAYFEKLAAFGRDSGNNVFFRASQDGITEVELYEGRTEDARRQLLAALQSSKSGYGKAHYLLYLAEVDSLTGRLGDAKEEVAKAMDASKAADLALFGVQVLASVGEFEQAHHILTAYQNSGQSLATEYSGVEQFVDGLELQSQSNIDQSIVVLSDAYRFDPQPVFAYSLAHVQMRGRKWKDARDTLERLVGSRGLFLMGDEPSLLVPLAERDLGICEKKLGEMSKAAQYFSAVELAWNRADASLLRTLTQAERN